MRENAESDPFLERLDVDLDVGRGFFSGKVFDANRLAFSQSGEMLRRFRVRFRRPGRSRQLEEVERRCDHDYAGFRSNGDWRIDDDFWLHCHY